MVASVNLIERITRAVEARLVAEIATDGPEYDAVYDRAFDEAVARGLERDEVHREAARVADEWKAAQQAGKP